MQTLLVFGTVKVSSAQAGDAFVVTPEEEGDGEVRKPGEQNVAPQIAALNALRRQLNEEVVYVGGADRATMFVQVDGDEDGQTDDSDASKNVSAHVGEA